MEDLRCPICLSILSRNSSPTLGSLYQCALSNAKHYIGYQDVESLTIEEESIVLILNNRIHTVTQYNYPPTYDLVITVLDEEEKYAYSKELYFSEPPFDFLHDDLEQSVKRLKTILTFR